MAKSIHLYKLFYDSDFKIGISVPKSIIKGFGFEEIMYMTSDSGSLKFAEIGDGDIPDILKIWKRSKEDYSLIKQNGITSIYTTKTPLSNEFVIQEFIKDATEVQTTWSSERFKCNKLINSVIKEANMKRTMEVIKLIIDKEIKQLNCKLSKLEITFLITDKTNYCLGINSYTYVPIITSRVSQPVIPSHKAQKIKEKTLKKKPKIPLLKSRLTVKDKIDQAIEEITKQQESIRNITYKSWIDKVVKGEKLYPNEELFAKKIVKNIEHKGRSAAKCLRELKILSMQLRVSLSEKKVHAQLSEGIRKTIESKLKGRKPTFMITKPALPLQQELSLNEISAVSARNLLNNSLKDLGYLSKTHRLAY